MKIAGIVPETHDDWMKQIARNLTAGVDGFLKGYRYLIHDRAPCFSNAFRTILKDSEVKTIRLPRRSPNLNAFAERWVRTAKELCIDQMIFLGENSLHGALAEMETFYNRERPHQGLGGEFVLAAARSGPPRGPVSCSDRLGGLLRHDYRAAA